MSLQSTSFSSVSKSTSSESHSNATAVSFNLNSASNISFSNNSHSSFESSLLQYHMSSSLPSPKYPFMFDTELPEVFSYDNSRGSTSLSTPVTTAPSVHSSQSITEDRVQIFTNYYSVGSNRLATSSDNKNGADANGLYSSSSSNSFTTLEVNTSLKEENLNRANSSHSLYSFDALSSRSMTPLSPALLDININNRSNSHNISLNSNYIQPDIDKSLNSSANIQLNNNFQFGITSLKFYFFYLLDINSFQNQIDKIIAKSMSNALNNFGSQLDSILSNKLSLFNNEINKILETKKSINMSHLPNTPVGITQENNNMAASFLVPPHPSPAAITQFMNNLMGNKIVSNSKYPSTSSGNFAIKSDANKQDALDSNYLNRQHSIFQTSKFTKVKKT